MTYRENAQNLWTQRHALKKQSKSCNRNPHTGKQVRQKEKDRDVCEHDRHSNCIPDGALLNSTFDLFFKARDGLL